MPGDAATPSPARTPRPRLTRRSRTACGTPPAGRTGRPPRTSTKKCIYGRTSANLDLTYYFNLAGEHAWKFGVPVHPAVRGRRRLPRASLGHAWYWGTPYVWPDGRQVMGKYGYYQIRGSFVSALRQQLDDPQRQLGLLPPGFLDDRRPPDPEPRRPDRERIRPGHVHGHDAPRIHGQADPVRLRPEAGPPPGRHL